MCEIYLDSEFFGFKGRFMNISYEKISIYSTYFSHAYELLFGSVSGS